MTAGGCFVHAVAARYMVRVMTMSRVWRPPSSTMSRGSNPARWDAFRLRPLSANTTPAGTADYAELGALRSTQVPTLLRAYALLQCRRRDGGLEQFLRADHRREHHDPSSLEQQPSSKGEQTRPHQ